MNLYLLTQSVNNDYDTYDSIIVCAETEDDARNITPYGDDDFGECSHSWVKHPSEVIVKKIGIADTSIKRGVLHSSFHAG